MNKIAALTMAFALLQGPAHGADISLTRGVDGNEDVVSIQGPFNLGDDAKFKAIALRTDRATVVLDSPGGKVQPALEIGRVIRIKGFSTAVQGNQCASACALVWLAGEPRMMSTLTPIGFHASYAIDDQGKKTSDAAQGARIGAYLTGLGFNSKVVTFAVSAGAKEMRWLQKGMAERLGIAVASSTPAQRRLAYESFTTGLKARAASMPAYEDVARLYRQSADLGFSGSTVAGRKSMISLETGSKAQTTKQAWQGLKGSARSTPRLRTGTSGADSC